MKAYEHILPDYDVKLVGSEDDVETLRNELGALRELARAQEALREAEGRLASAAVLVASYRYDREYRRQQRIVVVPAPGDQCGGTRTKTFSGTPCPGCRACS